MTTSLKKLAGLVTRLQEKTAGEQLPWIEPHNGVFATTVGDTLIQLSVSYSDFDPEADPDFHLTLLRRSQIIDTVSDSELQGYMTNPYLALKSLYGDARRTARDVANIADELNAELDKDAP
jgi:hypothetical protein